VFYHLLVAVVAIAALAGGWVAVQALVRRQSPDMPRGSDVLQCRMCGAGGMCHCSFNPEQAAAVAAQTQEQGERLMPGGKPGGIQ
jgi:hypothetical protein